VATAPESTHDPIVYSVAVIKGSRNEDTSRKFVEFLSSPMAQAIFVKHGFTIATL
jgi:molybdate transport system substrate-binding protein